MVNHEQQDGNAATPSAPAAIPPLTPKGASRRRIAGLGVSGIVMTVASNHAMAELVCKSPSGALSGNLNSQSPNVSCEGRSPGFWKNHQSEWPSEVKTTDLFSKFFSAHGLLGNLTCLQVLGSDEDDKEGKPKLDKHNVAMHIMATYLNVVSGRITFLTRQAVIDMWAHWNTNQSYTPAVGADPWNGDEFVNYLSSTQKFSG